MQSILVPTDFSDTALNAAHYAIAFAKQFSISKIILFNAYQAPLSVDPTTPVLQLFNLNDIKQVSIEGLTFLRDKLSPGVGTGIQLEMVSEFATVADSINEVCSKSGAGLIIMGITGGSGLDVLVGSNTISVADTAKVPVIIVPATCVYKPVKSLVWVFDTNGKVPPVPLLPVKSILEVTQSKLHILSVDPGSSADGHNSKLSPGLLEEYNPEVFYVYNKHFAEAVNEFVESNHEDMIITISKKHGFFKNIFRTNHTKQLAFHTHVPLLCVHEEV